MNNFIKQCEQAEEIQKGHKWEDSDKLAYRRCINVRDCDYEELIKRPEYYEMTYGKRKIFGNIDIDKPIYIPTQENLWKEIWKLAFKDFNSFKIYKGFVVNERTKIVKDYIGIVVLQDGKNINEFNGEILQECLIQIIYKYKYHKFWNGEIWERIKDL